MSKMSIELYCLPVSAPRVLGDGLLRDVIKLQGRRGELDGGGAERGVRVGRHDGGGAGELESGREGVADGVRGVDGGVVVVARSEQRSEAVDAVSRAACRGSGWLLVTLRAANPIGFVMLL